MYAYMCIYGGLHLPRLDLALLQVERERVALLRHTAVDAGLTYIYISLSIYIYIYIAVYIHIYIYRERDSYLYIYIYI